MSFQTTTVLSNFHKWTSLVCLLTLDLHRVHVLAHSIKDRFSRSEASSTLLFVCVILVKVPRSLFLEEMFNLPRSVGQHIRSFPFGSEYISMYFTVYLAE